jgi:hypothetical protein
LVDTLAARTLIPWQLAATKEHDMAEFIINQDVVTDVPVVEVTVTTDRPLPIGRQRFQLIVTDDSNNASRPDVVEVIVADQDAPTAVLNVPSVVGFGRSFNMSGERSFDVGGGRIVRYAWTYLGPSPIVAPPPIPRPTPTPTPTPIPR